MEPKKSFVVYSDCLPQVEMLDLEQRGELFTAMLAYAQDGTELPLDDMTAMAFAFIRAQMDRDAEKWEATRARRAEAGRRGGYAKAARLGGSLSSDPAGDVYTPGGGHYGTGGAYGL